MAHIVELTWAGGEHAFGLAIGGLRAIQDATGRGPMTVYRALGDGTWLVDDILAVLRHGLAGGGMEAREAKELVHRVADSTPLMSLAPIAHIIIAAALVGDVDDPVGEAAGETEPPIQNSNSPSSTATAQKQDSRRVK